jgi:hypothetical protein
MAKTVTNLVIFASSPSDLAKEREQLANVVDELNKTICPSHNILLELRRSETDSFPAAGTDPQAVINEQISEYDIFIGIMWTKFGTPTPRAGSGTEEEFNQAYSRYKANPRDVRIIFYFKDAPPSSLSDVDIEQLAKIRGFRDKIGRDGIYYFKFADAEAFLYSLRLALSNLIREWGQKWGPAKPPPTTAGPPNAGIAAVPTCATDAVRPTSLEEAEYGMLDLLEQGEDAFKSVQSVVQRMTRVLSRLAEAVTQRTKEIEQAKARSVPLQPKAAKKIVNAVAREMEKFAKLMKVDVSLFSEQFSVGMSSFSKAMMMGQLTSKEDLGQLGKALQASQQMRSVVLDSRDKLALFRRTIAALPPMTTALNKAKRSTLDVLDLTGREFERAIGLIDAMERTLRQLGSGSAGEGEDGK